VVLTFAVPAVLAGISFMMYALSVREGCRWVAWLAAAIMGLGSFLILRGFDAPVAGRLLEDMVLVMVAIGLIARQRFGRQLAGRHSLYREHRLRRSLF